MEFLNEYGLFLAKFVTVFLFLIISIGIVLFLVNRNRQSVEGHLVITYLNDKYDSILLMLKSRILNKQEFKSLLKQYKAEHKKKEKGSDEDSKRKKMFVIEFKGDIRATEVASLREEITAIVSVATPDDEVLVVLESAGGTVHGYGLAASQLKRIRDRNIHLTIAVDKVAASGGYMMACVGNRILAAPFAIIGSVGVLAQIPNFNRLLKKHNIDFEQITAGEFKRTLTLFGENTDKDREKFREELEDTHQLFKDFIHENRPVVDIDKISTGEHWYGKQALALNLVDDLQTSDDYICAALDQTDIYRIEYTRKKPISEKLFSFGAKMQEFFS